jgi:predicted branched-subunit amino acid permease
LDFANTAVLIALLLGLWRSGSKKLVKLIPWVVAALVAVVCSKLLPDKWYILMGGIAGSVVGAWIDGD